MARFLERVPMGPNHLPTVMPARRHPAALRGGDPLFAGIHVFLAERQEARRGWLGHKGVHARLRRAAARP